MIDKLIRVDNYWNDEEEVSYDFKWEYIWTNIFGFCGCGSGSEMFMFIAETLEKIEENKWGNYEDKAYMMIMYWADEKGLTEHGTSVRCSWLTEKGKEVLADMKWCIENEKDEF